MFKLRIDRTPRFANVCRCSQPDRDIERVRNALKTQFYTTQRDITFHEVEMILKPLFQDISMDIAVVDRKVQVVIANNSPVARDFDTNHAILDLVNEWKMHDKFRRFLVKGITNANRNNVHRYEQGIVWKCPIDVYYVFEDEMTV